MSQFNKKKKSKYDRIVKLVAIVTIVILFLGLILGVGMSILPYLATL